MEVKANVQKRRQDRIRNLQQDAERSSSISSVSAGEPVLPRREDMRPGMYRLPEEEPYDERWNDPEYAWKQREKELLAWYGADTRDHHSGGGGERKEDELKDWNFVPSKNQIWKRLLASVAVFGLVWGLFQVNAPWTVKGKQFVTKALTEDMDMQKAAAWYRQAFSGAPSFLPAFGSHKKEEATKVSAPALRAFTTPVHGAVITPYSEKFQGVVLETPAGANVKVLDSGRIIFAGNREESGYTIVVQHTDGYRSTYGYLQPAKWEVSDWLTAQSVVGTVENSPAKSNKGRLFLSIMKEQRYLDPAEVVSFD